MSASGDKPAGITAVTDPGGREALRLQTADDDVLVSLVGAQVLSWHHRGVDVLWTASHAEYAAGKPVRGGIPVVFPWFNENKADKTLPAHGFVRNLPWRVVDQKDDGAGPTATLELTDDAATRAMWPHAFCVQLEIALGASLRVAFTIENRGTKPFACEEALHTYFAVGDVHEAAVRGLENVPFTEHAALPETEWDPTAPLRFRAETDRVFQDVPERIEIDAPALQRTVTLTTENSHSAIVWNPWPEKTARLSQMAPEDWQRFVCVESANIWERGLEIAPGATHTMVLALSCQQH